MTEDDITQLLAELALIAHELRTANMIAWQQTLLAARVGHVTVSPGPDALTTSLISNGDAILARLTR